MDIFGHRDFEMTLRYILSHPEIAKEALRVAEEVAHVFAESTISETLHDKTGGLGAAEIRRTLDRTAMNSGEQTFGTTTLRETAEVLTFGGRTWQIVRDGVLCTKRVDQTGPCTRSRGTPDPGSCHSDCLYRTEMGRTRAQCSQAIEAVLRELAAVRQECMPMLVEHLSGQLLAQLNRWPDVREYWLRRSALARDVWTSRRQ